MPSPIDPEYASLLLDSHARIVGTPLLPERPAPDEEAARILYEEAPFGLLAHDTSGDPLFVYANCTAQACFEYSWEEFIGLPSRLSALPSGQRDREALLGAVAERHFASGYRGLRVAKSGRRFWVGDLTMWDLIDDAGARVGQAAAFRSWTDA
ncbi:MEKHLA domain-containing protein [Streptomyces sp. NBC_00280]|uniref:MEKHLA domain-containing protein n=1 Tax=Streptomyces sp. NBC_00280 TaxID=2975699 RepID=UPI0032467296